MKAPVSAGEWLAVLKNGCWVEALQLGDIDKIELALPVYLAVAWRLAHLVRLGRTHPDLSARDLFSEEEWKGAYLLTKQTRPATPPTLRQIARLGGFLGRKCDGVPGVKTPLAGLRSTARLRPRSRKNAFSISKMNCVKGYAPNESPCATEQGDAERCPW